MKIQKLFFKHFLYVHRFKQFETQQGIRRDAECLDRLQSGIICVAWQVPHGVAGDFDRHDTRNNSVKNLPKTKPCSRQLSINLSPEVAVSITNVLGPPRITGFPVMSRDQL